jgi:catechol 2,3-dioxygenase-like lactoylglutathione lyase family enzyme
MKQGSLRMDHIALPIFDVAATYEFYNRVLQFPLMDAFSGDDWGGAAWLMMIFEAADGRKIALTAFDGTTQPIRDKLPRDARHFAFTASSTADLASWKARLSAAKVDFWEEDHDTQQSIYFADSNGIILEITTPESAPASTPNPTAPDVVKRWMAQH